MAPDLFAATFYDWPSWNQIWRYFFTEWDWTTLWDAISWAWLNDLLWKLRFDKANNNPVLITERIDTDWNPCTFYYTEIPSNPTISQVHIDWVTYDLRDRNAGGNEKRIDVSFSSQSTKTVSDPFVNAATVAMWTFEWTLNWYVQMEVNAWSLKITSSSTETWKFHICLKNNDGNVKSY